jgi:hypothetical protein
MIKMRVFQIINNNVLIINDNKEYTDTFENFLADSGAESLGRDNIIYDDQQQQTVIGNEFKKYPDDSLETYIDNIDNYIAAKVQREYVPPTVDELKQQALDYQYKIYVAAKNAVVWVDGLGFDTDENGQRDWQIALTLIDADGKFKVYDDKNSPDHTILADITKSQMVAAGNAARAQQLQAYGDFVAIREKIKKCETADELSPYLPTETA